MKYFLKIACVIILTCQSVLFATGYIRHLKKAEGKSNLHTMKNIDFIYMINLDQRPEKFERSYQMLSAYGIYPYRFSAVNGWELSLEAINEIGLHYQLGMKKLMSTCYPVDANGSWRHELIGTDSHCGYFGHCASKGSIGIILSHLSILTDAEETFGKNDYTIWVMEDDIEVVKDPRLLSVLVKRLDDIVGKNNWDILFTDVDTRNKLGEYVPCTTYAPRPNFTPSNPLQYSSKKKISSEFTKTGARYGAYSIIYRRSGVRKILGFYRKYGPYLPYDMDNYLVPGIRMYRPNWDIVTHWQNASSDNGGANYLK
ncbi:MAG: hypothetical protein JW769_04275 [Parachlamydiales bacterium]|nr:hypothetical protein [Parachlamydiales bacterium]